MKLINQSAQYLPQGVGIDGIYKQIELAGRTCYKSEANITPDSAKEFVERMMRSGHTAMLEHGTVYLDFGWLPWDGTTYELVSKYIKNKYSKVCGPICEDIQYKEGERQYSKCFVTTNLRVLQENRWLDDLKYICEPTEYHERRISLRFITDRGVSHELVRHRVFSFAQESTRYCNYSKDKFGNELTFIVPSWSQTIKVGHFDDLFCQDAFWHNVDGGERMSCNDQEMCLVGVFNKAEQCYMEAIERGLSPQQARQLLPNAIKTEIVMTGFISDWKHFFDLRLFGTTGKPHPDMLLLAQKAKKVLEENDLWYLIYKPNEN